jgi:hypothetical protein
MAKFNIGDKIAKVRKVKDSGRIVEQLQTGTITSDCFIVENLQHYQVEWDIKDGETMSMIDGIGLISLPRWNSKPKYDYIHL